MVFGMLKASHRDRCARWLAHTKNGKKDEGRIREQARAEKGGEFKWGMNSMMLQGLFINEIRRCMTWHQVGLGYSFVKVYTSIAYTYSVYIPKLITLQSE